MTQLAAGAKAKYAETSETETRDSSRDLSRRSSDDATVALREAVLAKLVYSVGKNPTVASERDWFVATALAVRDKIVEGWM